MKQAFLIILIYAFYFSAAGQQLVKNSCYQKEITISKSEKIFQKMEIKPSFKGGDDTLNQFILSKIDINRIANSINENTRYFIDTVKVKFVVSRNRQMSNLSIENSKCPELKKEIEKVLILSSCNWVPGVSAGRELNGWYSKNLLFSFDRRGSFLSIKIEFQD